MQTPKSLKKNASYYDKIQHANFPGKPSFQAIKQHLTVKRCKNEISDTYLFLVELFCYCFGFMLHHDGGVKRKRRVN